MTPGAGPAMGAGIVAAHTSPHRMQQDDYPGAGTGQYRTGGAPERPLPPPREAEEPKRNPTGPILVVVAGIAVLLIALFLIKPWDNSGDEGDNTADDGGTPDTATDAARGVHGGRRGDHPGRRRRRRQPRATTTRTDEDDNSDDREPTEEEDDQAPTAVRPGRGQASYLTDAPTPKSGDSRNASS